MDEPLTEELLQELLSCKRPDDYLDHHELGGRTFSGYLCELLEAHGLKRADVVRDAGLDITYGYQLFSGGRKKPGRDKVLALAFAMGCTPRECDRLLQAAGVSRLYCKDERDAVIIFCLDRHVTLQQTDELLFGRGLATIGKK